MSKNATTTYRNDLYNECIGLIGKRHYGQARRYATLLVDYDQFRGLRILALINQKMEYDKKTAQMCAGNLLFLFEEDIETDEANLNWLFGEEEVA